LATGTSSGFMLSCTFSRMNRSMATHGPCDYCVVGPLRTKQRRTSCRRITLARTLLGLDRAENPTSNFGSDQRVREL
jgi:hypothetical protein